MEKMNIGQKLETIVNTITQVLNSVQSKLDRILMNLDKLLKLYKEMKEISPELEHRSTTPELPPLHAKSVGIPVLDIELPPTQAKGAKTLVSHQWLDQRYCKLKLSVSNGQKPVRWLLKAEGIFHIIYDPGGGAPLINVPSRCMYRYTHLKKLFKADDKIYMGLLLPSGIKTLNGIMKAARRVLKKKGQEVLFLVPIVVVDLVEHVWYLKLIPGEEKTGEKPKIRAAMRKEGFLGWVRPLTWSNGL